VLKVLLRNRLQQRREVARWFAATEHFEQAALEATER
jgi:hypothetical protein